jgi:hypothetical protein
MNFNYRVAGTLCTLEKWLVHISGDDDDDDDDDNNNNNNLLVLCFNDKHSSNSTVISKAFSFAPRCHMLIRRSVLEEGYTSRIVPFL